MITQQQSRDLFMLNKLRQHRHFDDLRYVVEQEVFDADESDSIWRAVLELMGDAQK